MLDDALARGRPMLRLLDAGFPAVHEMTGAEARGRGGTRAAGGQPRRRRAPRTSRSSHSLRPVPRCGLSARTASRGPGPAVVVLPRRGIRLLRHRQPRRVLPPDGPAHRHRRGLGRTTGWRPSTPRPPRPRTRTPPWWVAAHAADLGDRPGADRGRGDSAGGNLAAVVAFMAATAAAVPAGAGAALPGASIRTSTPRATGASHRVLQHPGCDAVVLGAVPRRRPRPARSARGVRRAGAGRQLAGLPPAVVVTAGLDPLSQRGQRYAAAAARGGVTVRHRDYPGLFHGFLTMMAFPPAAAARELLWSDVGTWACRRPPGRTDPQKGSTR